MITQSIYAVVISIPNLTLTLTLSKRINRKCENMDFSNKKNIHVSNHLINKKNW